MHVHGGQEVHHIGRLIQWNPVELHVLTGGEVTVAFDEARGFSGQQVLLGLGFKASLCQIKLLIRLIYMLFDHKRGSAGCLKVSKATGFRHADTV